MDERISQELAEVLFGRDREAVDCEVALEDGTLGIVRLAAGGPVTVALSMPASEPAESGLEWAWLEATWLRRLHDGVVATADVDGRLGFGVVLAGAEMSAERLRGALEALVATPREAAEPPPKAADEALSFDDTIWMRV